MYPGYWAISAVDCIKTFNMTNPFDALEERLTNIESLLLDLKQSQSKKEEKPQTELIRRKEARQLLGGISNPTIINYEKRGLIKSVRIGGTILYDRNEILHAKK